MDLLDTNLVSEWRKVKAGRADPGVAAWAKAVEAGQLFLFAVTLHELELGVLLIERRDPVQGRWLRQGLDQAVCCLLSPAASWRWMPKCHAAAPPCTCRILGRSALA